MLSEMFGTWKAEVMKLPVADDPEEAQPFTHPSLGVAALREPVPDDILREANADPGADHA